MHVHCEGASHHNAVLNDSQGVPGHIEAIAQGVPLAPEEQGDTAGGYTAAIDGFKITGNKYGRALRNNRLSAATGDSKITRLPRHAVPARDGRSRRATG